MTQLFDNVIEFETGVMPFESNKLRTLGRCGY